MSIRKLLKPTILKIGLPTAIVAGLCISNAAYAGKPTGDECPVELLNGLTLNEEFGSGTSNLTSCMSNRSGVKIVMQLNKSCRDSYATHPVDSDGKPTGDVSKVVNNIANCADNRPYALGNLVNMYKDLTITNGIDPGDIDIKVVVHSGGGYVLLKDEGYDGNGNWVTGRNKFQGQVEALMADGVKFYFCQNTARSFIKNNTLPAVNEAEGGATAQLIEGVQYVTAGVTAIADLQDQGYHYVQP